MSQALIFGGFFASLVIGMIFGAMTLFLMRKFVFGRQIRIAERKAARLVAEARQESKDIVHEAKQEADKTKAAAEQEFRDRRTEVQRQENRVSQKSDSLDRKLNSVEQRE